ncbi:MAG: ABC-2 type transport system permease protein [Parcubacteria group bacterium Gr01-1014_18]|nr:MAG: ABC-2 type transport system permease protein [Parcubacteria group bacterium Greene0416_36]TSC80949.1 MAG: ABC-2 type transport system permease protein [Parcubacteria group bacterium Gr01-1014_18]TSC98708.1 MAG: ABC-2 type transport system permease protein [Parcubacteria group bacterium Greene1014_20]TSD06460.1 MAG: ABC-2 type transport system permease protein [Parcubacteria group bacterium Greene0714_2]
MGRIWAIAKKELSGYLNSPAGYIFLSVFLVFSSWIYWRTVFLVGEVSFRSFFNYIPWIFLFLIPAISMKLWSEEKKLGTMEVLLTWPIRDWEAILGKFFGSLGFLILALAGTLISPLALSYLGSPDWGMIFSGYMASLLLAASYLAIGMWASALSRNQIVAFIMGVLFIFMLLLAGSEMFLYFVPVFLTPILSYLSLGTHFDSIAKGVIDSRDVLYYFSVIFFFLYLNKYLLSLRKN